MPLIFITQQKIFNISQRITIFKNLSKKNCNKLFPTRKRFRVIFTFMYIYKTLKCSPVNSFRMCGKINAKAGVAKQLIFANFSRTFAGTSSSTNTSYPAPVRAFAHLLSGAENLKKLSFFGFFRTLLSKFPIMVLYSCKTTSYFMITHLYCRINSNLLLCLAFYFIFLFGQ